MKIEFLKNLEENKKIGFREIKGVSEVEIEKVEKKYAIKFPNAYREFLYLAGESRGALPLLDTAELEDISADWHMEIMKEEMEESGTIISRPFWLFAETNGCEAFYFFYLDENTDDPQVRLYNYHDYDDNKRVLQDVEVTFSKFIEDMIDLAFRYEKEGY
jgi:NACalpha-BTF3-like transcription factor